MSPFSVMPSWLLNSPQQRLSAFTAFLLGASLPTANSLMNVALGLVVLCLLWRRDFRQYAALTSHPLVWLPALMFILLALSLLTHSHGYGVTMVGKYKKLLYVLPLALFFLAERQRMAQTVSGFLWANALILLLSLSSGLGQLSLWGLNPDNPTVFKLQITQNVFMALAALVWLTRAYAGHRLRRWGYGILVLLASTNVLLMVQGRSGYVALMVGISIWLLLTLRHRQRTTVMVGGMLAIALLALTPNRAMERLALGFQQIQDCILAPEQHAYHTCDNSMGQRTAFARESWRLIKQAPLLGNGAGSFWYGNAATGYSVHNPHNEYLLETVQSGLLGLGLFLSWMWFCYRTAWQQPARYRNLLVAVLSSYMACHLFNSFLLDSSEGHLFVIIAAWLASLTVSSPRSPIDDRQT
ncbi:O-antigen ligase family protein [Serratia sp. NPDC078593]|uniref:O-antigen ligase family protein n=1 Tax=unclassified Serratia (in: enterobacteria) TaxID=2647522 RepID=UPI0037CEA3C6